MRFLIHDIRHGLRTAVRTPGFTAVAVLTLALGIGANTAIFSVVHAVLIAPLPYRDADRVVVMAEETSRRPGQPNTAAPFNLAYWQERSKTLERVAAYFDGRSNLAGDSGPEEVVVQVVTTNFFETLGVEPAIGRAFAPDEGVEGRDDVAVLGHGLWRRRFAGNPSIVGRSIQLGGRPVLVAGVMPAGFSFVIPELSLAGRPPDLWMPFALAGPYREWQGRYMGAVGRVRDGMTVEESRSELRGIASALEREFPQYDAGWTAWVRPVREALTGGVRPALFVLTASVGFVLLIACANVANLLLARGAARQREIAVRRALGASRLRIARQLLTESLVFAMLGGGAGLLIAGWSLDSLVALSPVGVAELGPVQLNYTILAFTTAVSAFTALASGLAFAIEGSRGAVRDALTGGARQVGAGVWHNRLRAVFVVAEIALAVVLLAGAGVMLRSYARILAIDPGFRTDNVLTARVGLPSRKYAESEQRLAFFREAVAGIRALPGVEAAGAVSFLPLAGLGAATSFTIEGEPAPAPGQSPVADVRVSDNGYFDAMRIPLVRGRFFTEREMRENAHVVIVNEALARAHFAGDDPLGRRLNISMGPPPRVPTEIVGVVGDVRQAQVQAPARPTAYWPHSQLDYTAMTLTVRTSGEPLALSTTLERTIHALDADQPVSEVWTMNQWVSRSLAARRFNTLLLTTFACLAAAMAALGVYGVMSYVVSQRTGEIGLRLALGADAREVRRMVVGNALRLTGVGLAIGAGLSLMFGGAITRLLYQTSGTDPVTLAAVIVFLGGVAALASYGPARRASRIEPLEALRYQ
jgi:putative ABC transport system permease protein